MTNFDRVVGLMGASVVAIACASPAMAQTRTYSIPAQSASSGVAALARQSDQQVLISARDAKGKKTREVRGEMTIEQAFAKLLAGSGLTAKRTGAGAWAVVQGGNADAAPARTEASAGGSNVVAAPRAPASTVVDARTGAALKGALVEIVETGEKTSTGDLGEFRFPGKTGSFGLRISYLGYPAYEQFVDLRDGRATTGILLSDGSATGDIVVTAYQSSRAQALNQERTADNTSTVISDDLTGRFDGTTISDALRRAPGVSFTQDELTGEGTNIIVRGMNADYNTVALNGARLPVNSGVGRAPLLNNILADSVSKITINKTLLPSQDGTGTGGLVEIETKGPLDRPDRFVSLSVEKGLSGKSFFDEEAVSGTISWKFGENKNFGVSASVQYRQKSQDTIQVGASDRTFGDYLPAGVTSVFRVDPRTPFPFEGGSNARRPTGFTLTENTAETKNLAVVLSAQLQLGGHTDLRLDLTRNSAKQDYQSQSLFISNSAGYELLPVADLGGEQRYAYVWEGYFGSNLSAFANRQYTIVDGAENLTRTAAFSGKTNLSSWEIDYGASYGIGSETSPGFSLNLIPPSFYLEFSRANLAPAALEDTVDGRIISLFSSGRDDVAPRLNESGWSILNDENNHAFSNAQNYIQSGKNKRLSANINIKKNFKGSFLKYIQTGVYFERSSSSRVSGAGGNYFSTRSLSELGLSFDSREQGRIREISLIDQIPMKDIYAFYKSIDANSLTQFIPTPVDPLTSAAGTVERDIAGYAQAGLTFGDLDIIGGVRLESFRTDARSVYQSNIINEDGSYDADFAIASRTVANESASSFTFLPRVMLNYRPTDNVVVRLGYYSSIARPSLQELSQAVTFDLNLMPIFGPDGNQPTLAINKGNPDLKSARTHNLDLSLEWYFSNVGVLKVGAFYKPTKNPLRTGFFGVGGTLPEGIDLPDDPRFRVDNLLIFVGSPINSPEASKLWGLEFALERRFDFLPGWMNGFGVYANYTYTRGSQTETTFFSGARDGTVTIKNLPYDNQPPHSGTLALTYSRNGIDGSVGYTMQSSRLSGFPRYGYQFGSDRYATLDAKLNYNFKIGGADIRAFVEGSNLLSGTSDTDVQRIYKSRTTGDKISDVATYLGGRTLRFGLGANV